MKLETFFEKFDLFADAPDAVAKMRELILESAIRGKLVPQNTSDEPASALLKRLAGVQVDQARKQAALPPVGDDAYLDVPPRWTWTRLGNIGRIFNGNSVSESGKAELAKVEDGLPFIATKDVGYGRDALVYDNGLKVPLGDPCFKAARANAVLICAEGGSAGRKIGITDRDICFGNKLVANEVREGIHHRYIFYIYQAPTFFKEFAARMTGIIGGIARSEFLSLPIPLPPEQEQKRIVAKVDELMALCDQLETQQQEREMRHAAIAHASLARFSDVPTPANLDLLFHPSYTIPPADLRKSILTLAVKGKLVPQDPNDEPAEELVTPQVTKSASSKNDREAPFELPNTWRWMHLGQVSELINGDRSKKYPNKAEYVHEGVPWINTGHIEPDGTLSIEWMHYITREKFDSLRSGKVRPGDLVYCLRGATLGKTAIITQFEEGAVASSLVIVRLSPAVDPRFAYRFLTSPLGREQIYHFDNGSAQPNLSANNVKKYWIPLPPIAEQRRIVAKVDQLMASVDALETQLAASRVTAEKLMEAIVVELTA